jgi:hypothetical protein
VSAVAGLAVPVRPVALLRVTGSRVQAVAAIVLCTVVLLSVAPTLVPAELDEHLSLLLVSGCAWALLAAGCVVLTPIGPGHARWTGIVVSVWLATLAGGPFFPATESGFPPLMVVAPPLAAVLTAVLSIHQAGKART